MGETTCVMHAFSYSPGTSNETQEEGNPTMYGLGDSISFGRFATENLSWEKWSAFDRNRYVDEAKSYSKPGSVAQKKAYFEAHFKRIATLKEAALLENQENNNNINDNHHIVNSVSPQQGSRTEPISRIEANSEVEICAPEPSFRQEEEQVNHHQESVQVSVGDNLDPVADHNQPRFHDEENESSIANVGEENQAPQIQKNLCNSDFEDNVASSQDASAPPPDNKSNQKLSSLLPLVETESSMSSSSSPKRPVAQEPEIHPGKENFATPSGKTPWVDEPDENRTPLRMSFSSNRSSSFPVINKTGRSSKASKTPAQASMDAVPNPSLETSHTSRSKSPAAFKNNASSPARDRAQKRKGKATGIKKLFSCFCFGARPSSESYREKKEGKKRVQ